ncbi:MAG TPA: hypothetical protein VFM10_00660, partial [Terriglobales bacterium]|nr:hypothetical protein [Terriglobales bacterium]
LGTLGDKDSGDHGHLDVFNFLFREIPLQPVDVRPMLLPAELKQPIVFIISSGPSWSLHPNTWTPDQSHGHGAVSFSARAVFNNPLEARVAAIQAEVTNALRALATRISSVSDIQQNIRNTLDQLATRVDDCTQAVGDPAIVAGIRRAVEDIKRALNIP